MVAAAWNAAPGRKASDSTQIATPCAAAEALPSRLTTETNHNWQPTIATMSIPPGRPTRSRRRINRPSGRRKRHRSLSPERPRNNS